MKKSHSFDEMSDVVCMEPRCPKRLKQRLVDSKAPHNIRRCYLHHIKAKRLEQASRDAEKRG